MYPIKFFAAPIKSHLLINEISVLQFTDLIEKIVEIDENGYSEFFIIPDEFYCLKMDNNQTIFEFCYSKQNEDNDIITYFREIISKQPTSQDTYNDIFSLCDNMDYNSIIALAGIGENQFIRTRELFITNHPQVLNVKRYYLALSPNYDEFIKWLPCCFKNLYFHESAFDRIKGFGKLDDQKQEIIRHLTILDRDAKKIYNYENDEANALRRLKSEGGLECSGKGSNEGTGIFKIHYKKNGIEATLTCNPHTKLYDGHNDYRIYFCWGRDDIETGRLIIASMGGHWK